MTIRTESDDTADIRIHRVSGVLQFDELLEALAALYGGAEFRPEQNALWDLREADLTEFSTDQVRTIVGLVREKWAATGTARAALVVAVTADFGMARMYEQWLGAEPEGRVGVFEDFDEARAWVQGAEPGTR
jgi:hypothetical protein